MELGYCLIAFWDLSIIALKKLKSNNPDEPWDYLEPDSYYLITLPKTIGKALKTILAKQIAYFAEIYNLLLSTYIGRKRCISTE